MRENSKRRLGSLVLAGSLMIGGAAGAHADVNNTGDVLQEIHASTDYIEYVVKEGDTLSAIAEHFLGFAGDYQLLVKLNNIENENEITPGQVLLIPTDKLSFLGFEDGVESEKEDYENDAIYVVQDGDTLTCIVRAIYKVQDDLLIRQYSTYNKIRNLHKIYVGQILHAPAIEKLRSITPWDYSKQDEEMARILYEQNQCNENDTYLYCYPPVFVHNDPLDCYFMPCPPPPKPPVPPVKEHCHKRVLKPNCFY